MHPDKNFMRISSIAIGIVCVLRPCNGAQRYGLQGATPMTDVTQSDSALARGIPAAALRQPASATAGYLFGPVLDFLTLGGGSLIACAAITLLLPNGISSAAQGFVIVVLMFAINQPHFAHSYQMFYRNFGVKAFGPGYAPALRWRYVNAGVVVPAALIAFLVGTALTGSQRIVSTGANLMFFLVGWHYVKQGYGILIVDSVQKRLMFSNGAKLILRANGYACWSVAWLALNHALEAKPYLGLTYFSLPIPPLIYDASIVVVAVTTLATLAVIVQRLREANGRLPWNGVIAYLTTLYLWVVFVRINPLVLAVVPTFHSLQYLAVVWRYQLNAGATRGANPRCTLSALDRIWPDGVSRQLALFVAAGVVLGFLGFMGVPRLLDSLGLYNARLYGPSLFLFQFYIFINVHHYFLDNVMWRRGNPDVQQYIFGRAPKAR
jgi:hypothetical protein